MNQNGSARRYPLVARILHWSTVAAVVVAFVAMWFGKDLAGGRDGRAMIEQVHYWAGLSALLMLVMRLLAHLFYRTPAIDPPPPPPLRWAARAGHLALYGLLIVQPLLGLATLADKGEALRTPGGAWRPPDWLADAARAVDKAEDLHESVAWLFLLLIAVHAIAALWHHFVRRDNTLRRMF